MSDQKLHTFNIININYNIILLQMCRANPYEVCVLPLQMVMQLCFSICEGLLQNGCCMFVLGTFVAGSFLLDLLIP